MKLRQLQAMVSLSQQSRLQKYLQHLKLQKLLRRHPRPRKPQMQPQEAMLQLQLMMLRLKQQEVWHQYRWLLCRWRRPLQRPKHLPMLQLLLQLMRLPQLQSRPQPQLPTRALSQLLQQKEPARLRRLPKSLLLLLLMAQPTMRPPRLPQRLPPPPLLQLTILRL